MIKVLIVDDQELVRAGFHALIESAEDLEVVGEAGDGAAAIDIANVTPTDVILMDIRMPTMDGIEATRQIRAGKDAPEILILTTFDTDDNVFDALEAGAAGFLVKDTPPSQLLEAVRAAASGGSVISPPTARRLVPHLIAARGSKPSPPPSLEILTDREREVLALVARGGSNREISAELYISELTTKTHVSRILTKLNLESRVQAAVLAYETGLVRLGRE
ncbi:MAG: response regulator [Acidimicrobiia bacterium]|nr:response regulator [Acidimicrobiia bacterium]